MRPARGSLAVGAVAAILTAVAIPGAAIPGAAGGRYAPNPQIADQAEKPASYFDGCHGSVKRKVPRPCKYGDLKGARRVLLMGDSHAAQLQPALDAYGRQQGVRVTVVTKSSCPAADTAVILAGGARYRQCDAWHRAARAKLRRRAFGRFDVAVISSFARYGVLSGVKGRRLAGDARARKWRAGTARMLAALRRSAAKVIVVRSSPVLRPSTTTCLIRSYPDGSGCATRTPKALSGSAWRAEREAVARTAGSSALDLSQPYCGKRYCHPVSGKYLAFRNPRHWGRTYSAEVLSIPLGDAVQEQMPAP